MDPSPGNIAPSWPVAIAHGIRNTTNPMIHQPNADGPADWITAALVMNSTIATKIATMSNVVSTLGRIPPATRSEISPPESVSVVTAVPPWQGVALDAGPAHSCRSAEAHGAGVSGLHQMYPFPASRARQRGPGATGRIHVQRRQRGHPADHRGVRPPPAGLAGGHA